MLLFIYESFMGFAPNVKIIKLYHAKENSNNIHKSKCKFNILQSLF